MIRMVYIFLSVSLLCINVSAQEIVQWHNGMTFKNQDIRSLKDYKETELTFGKYYRLLQFDHLLSILERENLNKQGIEILEYIDGYSYLGSLNPSWIHARSNPEGLIRTYELSRNYRLSRQLLFATPCIKESGKYRLVAKYMKGIDVSKIKVVLNNQSIEADRIYPYNQILYLKLNEHELEWLSSQPWVQFMDCESEPGTPEDREGRSLHRVNLIASNQKENLHLKGEGVKVMVRDDGFVGPHIDFQGRIHQDVRDDSPVHHADGVSGILSGAGNVDPLIEGMAPGSELYVINYQPDFLDKTLDYHTNEGVVITNTSYSNGCNAGYTIEAQVVDKQIYENPELIHVFSAGNSNGADCGYGAGNQWGNVTGGHKIGKNVLTTANLRLDGTLETSSSRGPTKDGRLKPEISARGTNEVSTAPGNSTQVFGGTSAASPGVAGVCALLYEAYKSFHNGQNPESALIKASILNTATDIGTPGPDYQFGFGVIDAYRAYHLIAENRFQNHTIQQNEMQEYHIVIPAGSPLAKFMIYWAEEPASLLAPKALINDLDMEVIDPSGTVHKSWVLNPTPNATTLAAGASPGVDTLNNFEQVSISFPLAGTYTVRVFGKFLPSNAIKFYLLHEVENKLLRLSFPIGGEQFNITENTQVHYTSYGQDSIKIMFSPDAGKNWQLLGVQAPGTRLYSYLIPNNLSSDSCLIEISQGIEKDRSGYFTITSGVQGFHIDKYCPDEIHLKWNRNGKDSFEIYQLGEKYMDPVKRTVDTLITLVNDDPRVKKWFSIGAYDKSILSRRELAIETPDTLIGCNITRDLALSNSELNPLEYFSCGDLHLSPWIKVINRTNKIQTGFTIKAMSKSQIVEQTYSISINPYDTIEVKFDNDIVVDKFGAQKLAAWLEFDQDENPFNDTVFLEAKIIELPEKAGIYPMLEGFDNAVFPSDWIQENEAFDSKWNVVGVKDKNGVVGNALMYANQNSIYNSTAVKLVSKTADLTNAIQPYLYFDFAQHHFNTNIYYDSIRIKVTQVCGMESKEKILLSGLSTELNTVNPSADQNWFPNDTSWFWLAYDLSEFKGSKVIVEFEIVRGIGDRTFLDNVQIREKIQATESGDFALSPNPGCNQKNVRFNDTSNIDGKLYLWDVGLNGIPKTYVGKGPFTSKYTTSGTKRVVLKIKSDKNNDAIVIKDLAISNPASVGYSFNIISGRTVKFNNSSVNAVTYLWDFGDGTTSTEINPIHTFDSAKIYRVKLTITNPCGTYNRSVNVDLTLTSSDDVVDVNRCEIFPNPAFHEVYVVSKDLLKSFRLFNAEGELILYKQNINSKQSRIMLDELPAGIYTLSIITEYKNFSKKIEKQ